MVAFGFSASFSAGFSVGFTVGFSVDFSVGWGVGSYRLLRNAPSLEHGFFKMN